MFVLMLISMLLHALTTVIFLTMSGFILTFINIVYIYTYQSKNLPLDSDRRNIAITRMIYSYLGKYIVPCKDLICKANSLRKLMSQKLVEKYRWKIVQAIATSAHRDQWHFVSGLNLAFLP